MSLSDYYSTKYNRRQTPKFIYFFLKRILDEIKNRKLIGVDYQITFSFDVTVTDAELSYNYDAIKIIAKSVEAFGLYAKMRKYSFRHDTLKNENQYTYFWELSNKPI